MPSTATLHEKCSINALKERADELLAFVCVCMCAYAFLLLDLMLHIQDTFNTCIAQCCLIEFSLMMEILCICVLQLS